MSAKKTISLDNTSDKNQINLSAVNSNYQVKVTDSKNKANTPVTIAKQEIIVSSTLNEEQVKNILLPDKSLQIKSLTNEDRVALEDFKIAITNGFPSSDIQELSLKIKNLEENSTVKGKEALEKIQKQLDDFKAELDKLNALKEKLPFRFEIITNVKVALFKELETMIQKIQNLENNVNNNLGNLNDKIDSLYKVIKEIVAFQDNYLQKKLTELLKNQNTAATTPITASSAEINYPEEVLKIRKQALANQVSKINTLIFLLEEYRKMKTSPEQTSAKLAQMRKNIDRGITAIENYAFANIDIYILKNSKLREKTYLEIYNATLNKLEKEISLSTYDPSSVK